MEIEPTPENLQDPYVMQLIVALAKRDDEIDRLKRLLLAVSCPHDEVVNLDRGIGLQCMVCGEYLDD